MGLRWALLLHDWPRGAPSLGDGQASSQQGRGPRLSPVLQAGAARRQRPCVPGSLTTALRTQDCKQACLPQSWPLACGPVPASGLTPRRRPSCRGPDEDGEEEAAPGPRQAHDSLYRVHMPSLYSCGSSYGSEASIPAAAHTVSNAPVTEYM